MTTQLRDRYLRDRNNRYGIYLITHREPRPNGWKDETGAFLSFDAVIGRLQRLADSIATANEDAAQIRVCWIDVSDM